MLSKVRVFIPFWKGKYYYDISLNIKKLICIYHKVYCLTENEYWKPICLIKVFG